MVKIAYIYTGLNRGGAQTVLTDLVYGMKEKNIECIVISDEGELISEIKEKNIKHYKLPLANKSFLKIIKSIIGILKIIKEEEVGIIHSHHRYTTMLSRLISKVLSVEVIHTEHSVYNKKNFINLRGKNIIAVSKKVESNLIENNINSNDITVIYNGVSNKFKEKKEIRKKFNVDENNILIGVLARLSKGKGHAFLIESLSELLKTNDNIKIMFIGDGEEKENIKQLINKLNLERKVIMLGNRSDVHDIIQNFDFFILPSFFEGLPISILEIMIQKKVVIATDVGGISEIINNNNGILIKPKDKKQLVDSVKYCIKNKEKIRYMELNAEKTIKQEFTINNMIDRHINYYELIGGKNDN